MTERNISEKQDVKTLTGITSRLSNSVSPERKQNEKNYQSAHQLLWRRNGLISISGRHYDCSASWYKRCFWTAGEKYDCFVYENVIYSIWSNVSLIVGSLSYPDIRPSCEGRVATDTYPDTAVNTQRSSKGRLTFVELYEFSVANRVIDLLFVNLSGTILR